MKTNAGKVSRSQHPRILGIIIELSAKVRTAIHLSQAEGGFSFVSKSFGSPQLYTPQGLPSSWIPWALGCPPDLETNKNLPAGRSPRFAIDRRNLGFTADLGMKRAIPGIPNKANSFTRHETGHSRPGIRPIYDRKLTN
jgi:hypothetical protein